MQKFNTLNFTLIFSCFETNFHLNRSVVVRMVVLGSIPTRAK